MILAGVAEEYAKCGTSWLSEGCDPRGNETLRWNGIVDHHHAGFDSPPPAKKVRSL